MWNVSANPRQFDEAVAWFRGKVPIRDPEYRLLSERAKQRAFFISGVSRLDVLGDAWGSLRRALEQGTPYAEWKAQAGPALEAAWGQARPWQLETVFRTNVQSSYSAGRWAQLSEPDVRQARPYWMYDAVLDARTTEICRTRNGIVRSADDPWWRSNWPPLHYNCRSGVRALTQDEADARGLAEQLPDVEPQDGFGAAPDRSDWEGTIASSYRDDARGPWQPALDVIPDWQSYKRPERLPAIEAPTTSTLELPQYVDAGLGTVLLDEDLIGSVGPNEQQYLPWLPAVLERPNELWLLPMESGNRVVFRQRYIALYKQGRREIALLVEVHRGIVIRVAALGQAEINAERIGILQYARRQT